MNRNKILYIGPIIVTIFALYMAIDVIIGHISALLEGEIVGFILMPVTFLFLGILFAEYHLFFKRSATAAVTLSILCLIAFLMPILSLWLNYIEKDKVNLSEPGMGASDFVWTGLFLLCAGVCVISHYHIFKKLRVFTVAVQRL